MRPKEDSPKCSPLIGQALPLPDTAGELAQSAQRLPTQQWETHTRPCSVNNIGITCYTIHSSYSVDARLCSLHRWLFEFYIFATSKDIPGWAPTCDSAHSWRLIVLPHWEIRLVVP